MAKNDEVNGQVLRRMRGVLGWTRGRMLGWMEGGAEERLFKQKGGSGMTVVLGWTKEGVGADGGDVGDVG